MSPYFHVDKEDAAMQCVVLKKTKYWWSLTKRCLFFYDTSPFPVKKLAPTLPTRQCCLRLRRLEPDWVAEVHLVHYKTESQVITLWIKYRCSIIQYQRVDELLLVVYIGTFECFGVLLLSRWGIFWSFRDELLHPHAHNYYKWVQTKAVGPIVAAEDRGSRIEDRGVRIEDRRSEDWRRKTERITGGRRKLFLF